MMTLLVIYLAVTVFVILLWMVAQLLPEYWQQKRAEKERLRRRYNDLKLYRPGYYVEED